MRAALIASILLASVPSVALGQQSGAVCTLGLRMDEDLQSYLFARAAQSLFSSTNIAPDVTVSAELSDDHLFDGQRTTQPVIRLLQTIRPTSFRRKRAPGIVRFVGDPCGEHDLNFEATTANPGEVWTVDVRFDGGVIQHIHASRYFYEEARPMEQVNG